MQRTFYPPLLDEQNVIQLTPAQALVLERVLAGWNNPRISNDLRYTVDTVKTHVRRLMDKARADNRTHLVALIYSGAVRVLIPVGESYGSA